jgi:hypothetical protein
VRRGKEELEKMGEMRAIVGVGRAQQRSLRREKCDVNLTMIAKIII